MQRHGHSRADRERVVARAAVGAKHLHGLLGVTIDAKLEDLLAEPGEQRPRTVERDDRTVMNDRDAVGETLGLVEIVRGHEDRYVLA